MATLKDTVVLGKLSVLGGGSFATSDIQINQLKARTTSSTTSTTYGPGTSGQVLKSNGTNAYWGNLSVGFGNPVLIGQYDTDGSGQCTLSTLTNYNFYEIVISYTDDYWFAGTRGFVSKVVSRQSLIQHADGTIIPIYDGGAATERMAGLVKVTMNSTGLKMSWNLVARASGAYFYNYDDTDTDFRFKIYGLPIVAS